MLFTDLTILAFQFSCTSLGPSSVRMSTQHSYAAAEAALRKSADHVVIFQRQAGKKPAKSDRDSGDYSAQKDKTAAEMLLHIVFRHLHVEHDGKCDFKIELVAHRGEVVVENPDLAQDISQNNDKEDGSGSVQAVCEILHSISP